MKERRATAVRPIVQPPCDRHVASAWLPWRCRVTAVHLPAGLVSAAAGGAPPQSDAPPGPDSLLLLQRVRKHAGRFRKGGCAPSGLSWSDVRQRVGTLHLPNERAAKAAMLAADPKYQEASARELRMVELYCGR